MLMRTFFIAAAIVVASAPLTAAYAKTPFRVVATIQSSQPVLKYGDVVAFGDFEVQLYGVYADHSVAPSAAAKGLVHDISCDLSGDVVHYSRSAEADRRPVAMCYVYGNDIAARLVSSGVARDCRDMSRGIYTLLEQEGRTQRNEKTPTFLLPPECGN